MFSGEFELFKAFSKIEKVAPQATDECAPIPRAIRLRTLISRVPRQLLHLGEAFKRLTDKSKFTPLTEPNER